jgi:prophage regulatory protein
MLLKCAAYASLESLGKLAGESSMIKTARQAEFRTGALGVDIARHKRPPAGCAANGASNGIAKDSLTPGVVQMKALLHGESLKILRLPQVCDLTGLGRSVIYQMEADLRFPKRIKLGTRAVGWLEQEVHTWLANRIAASRGATTAVT